MKTLTILMLIFSTNVLAHHEHYTESQYMVNKNWNEYLIRKQHNNHHNHRHVVRYNYNGNYHRNYHRRHNPHYHDTVGSIIVDILLRN